MGSAALNQGSRMALLCPHLCQQEQQAEVMLLLVLLLSLVFALSMTVAAKPWPNPQPWSEKINICLHLSLPDLGRLYHGEK